MTFFPCKKLWFSWGLILAAFTMSAADTGQRQLPAHVPAPANHLIARGLLAATNELTLAISLPVRDQSGLGELIHQLYDPASTNFHRFLKRGEFAARFGATESDYQAVQDFARSNGFAIIGYHSNRLVLDVQARVPDVERAFHITLHTYRHPSGNRDFFAPDTDPSIPASLPVVDIWGLSDYNLPKPLSHPALRRKAQPVIGSGPGGFYAGNDLRNAYAPGSPLTGVGQTVGLFQFSSYSMSNITNYEKMIGRTNFVPLTNVILPGGTPRSTDNDETCLDIEMAIAMAPQLSRIIVYEIKAVDPVSLLNRMADDDLAMQLSSSWSWSGGPTNTVDAAFMQMITQGQSFFQASGDDDAYTGPQALDNVNQTFAPMDSTNITSVGGTTLTMNGNGASWASETTWNYNTLGFPNIGSGGGVSLYYTIPNWQTNVNTNLSQGSATFRNIPDVAMLADGVSVVYTSSGVSVTNPLAGTSCAAPMWAGFCALLNQQSVASGSGPIGFLNPAIYQLATQTNYPNCFHDITTGNNIGTNSPGLFNATSGYDLCTGLGSPNGMALINALAPRPAFLSQPISQAATNGATVTFTAMPLGAPPYSFQWLFNDTNLPAGANVSGVNSNSLTLTSVNAGSAGNYSLVFTNPSGVIISSVAALTVNFPPAIANSPINQTLLTGDSVTYTVLASGSTPLSCQWRQNGTNLTNVTGISGVATTNLSLTSVTTNRTGVYAAVVTNLFGATTNTIATLTVNRQVSSITLSSSNNPAGYLATLNFTAQVTPANATGTIQFLTNSTPFDTKSLAAGSALSANISSLPRGTNLITAIYSGDPNDLPVAGTFNQIVTNHPPIAAPAFFTLVAGLNLEIPVASLATNWSDADGDTLHLAALTVSTNGIAIANTTPDLFYSDTNYVNDQFTALISDGFGGTNAQIINISVVPQTNSQPVIAGVTAQPSGVTLKLTGGYNSIYVLLNTTNLGAGWQPLATNQMGITGVWVFTDSGFTNYPQDFYRLEQTP